MEWSISEEIEADLKKIAKYYPSRPKVARFGENTDTFLLAGFRVSSFPGKNLSSSDLNKISNYFSQTAISVATHFNGTVQTDEKIFLSLLFDGTDNEGAQRAANCALVLLDRIEDFKETLSSLSPLLELKIFLGHGRAEKNKVLEEFNSKQWGKIRLSQSFRAKAGEQFIYKTVNEEEHKVFILSGRRLQEGKKEKLPTVENKYFSGKATAKQKLELLLYTPTKSPQIVVVKGDKGTGKTSLVEEVLQSTSLGPVLRSTASNLMAQPFYSISTLIKSSLSSTVDTKDSIFEKFINSINPEGKKKKLIPFIKIISALSTEDLPPFSLTACKSALFVFLEEYLKEQGADGKGVLFFDNAQWIDGNSLLLLQFIAENIAELPLRALIIVYSGKFNLPGPIKKLCTVEINLNNYCREAAVVLRKKIEIYTKEKIDCLDREERKLLYLCATAGESFCYEKIMEGAQELSPKREDINHSVKLLEQQDFIQTVSHFPHTISFRHYGVREVIYNYVMTRWEQKKAHSALARAKERFYRKGRKNLLFPMVGHFIHSHNKEKLSAYLPRAVKYAATFKDMPLAQKLAEVYLNTVKNGENIDETIRLLSHYCDALRELGNMEKELSAIEQLVSCCEKTDNSALNLSGLLKMADFLGRTGKTSEMLNLNENIRLLANTSDSRINALISTASAFFQCRQIKRARSALDEALSLAEASCDFRTTEKILLKAGNICDANNDFRASYDFYSRALALFQKNGNISGEGMVLSKTTLSSLYLGNFGRALSQAEEALEVRKVLNEKRAIIFSMLDCARIYKLIGLYGEAKNYIRSAIELASIKQYRNLLPYCYFNEAQNYYCNGQYSKALRSLNHCYSSLDSNSENIYFQLYFLSSLIFSVLNKGNTAIEYTSKMEKIRPGNFRMEIELHYAKAKALSEKNQERALCELEKALVIYNAKKPAFMEKDIEMLYTFQTVCPNLDSKKKRDCLSQAYALLMARADSLSDIGQKDTFLTKVETHQKVISGYKKFCL